MGMVRLRAIDPALRVSNLGELTAMRRPEDMARSQPDQSAASPVLRPADHQSTTRDLRCLGLRLACCEALVNAAQIVVRNIQRHGSGVVVELLSRAGCNRRGDCQTGGYLGGDCDLG
jgi:hypothetical protein